MTASVNARTAHVPVPIVFLLIPSYQESSPCFIYQLIDKILRTVKRKIHPASGHPDCFYATLPPEFACILWAEGSCVGERGMRRVSTSRYPVYTCSIVMVIMSLTAAVSSLAQN